MAIDPAMVQLGVGLLGGMFGGGGGGPSRLEGLYERFQQILDEGMNLYRTTDWDQLFARSQEAYGKIAERETRRGLKNYDATLRTAGITPTGGDTEQSVQRGLVRSKTADVLAGRQANFMMQKPMLQKSLLPNVQDVLQGGGIGGSLDAYDQQRGAGNREAIGAIGDYIGSILQRERDRSEKTRSADYSGRSLVNDVSNFRWRVR
ncbi:MAG: hypothetical protein KIS66_16755 [Fimbriimonadaceae bacterium]|nr:hypothetical protein [Fimbriimonadaceae bacterium]